MTERGKVMVPISHVDFKESQCLPVEFKKCSCHSVDFKKCSCPCHYLCKARVVAKGPMSACRF